ncbi:MAG: 4'-phosphopantetheinyl transferase superfamily protein [Clostridiales bacterium]|jgi:3-oxoacyl-(acyl-carrier-protein) synthase/phosphopantetheinyl transferase|nr:4'-phosphopantetheinyl transferase superfamily protein [Clostridiales bacterium]
MKMDNNDIAIVGISIFCPAGESVDEFWQGIARGGDFITDAPEDIIDSYYFSGEPNGIDRFYCKRGGFANPFKLDPFRYGIMPVTAGGTDPDQLVSLAGAERALIDAGVFEKNISLQNCSMIIGKGNFSGTIPLRSLEIIRMSRQFTALLKSVLPDLTDADLEKVKKAYQSKHGRYQPDMMIGSMPNLVASLVANRFDMHGPAYTIDAACSSGIVAIHHSIQLLRDGQCDVAVAGGMHGGHSPMFWGAFDILGAMSHKQVIAPFSKSADGLLVGQGTGFVVLKTLRKALEDDDRIYAVIKETSVCSDGASAHVMVPSTNGQTRALEQAWKKAKMDPRRIGYVEAHGTATVVGDRIELTTLKNFFGDNTHPRAYVGSVKSNIGHAMPAAGMIGIIKAALALYWRKIPPTLHCEDPLDVMYESRFMPPQKLIDWDGDQIPLVAGVNAFGFGGVNAHAIMTPFEPEPGKPRKRPKPYLGETLMMSADDGQALIDKLEKGDYTNTGGNYRLALFDPDESRIRQAIDIVKNDEPCRGEADIWFSNRPLLANGGKIAYLFPDYDGEVDLETESISDMLDLPSIHDVITEPDGASGEARRLFTQWMGKAALKKLGVETGVYAGRWDEPAFAGATESDGNFEAIADVTAEEIQKLYEEQQARVFIQIGLGSFTNVIEGILKGKEFGVIATGEPARSGADQIRRCMALLFIEGLRADPAFMGVKPQYRVDHSLLILPRGVPMMTELPELTEVIQQRYGAPGMGTAITGVLSQTAADPIAAAADENIRDAIKVQRELTRLFERRRAVGVRTPAAAARPEYAPGRGSRFGETFEETLRLRLEDHPYLLDHSIIRQPEGWSIIDDLNPVVPFSMLIELFAEIAKKRAPGEKLVKIGNMSAYKWVGVEKPFETVIKGKWLAQDVLELAMGEYGKAECTFSNSWPEPPEEYREEIDIGAKLTEDKYSIAKLYDKYSFHGPCYFSNREQIKVCERGMQSIAEKREGKGSLLDAMSQQIGLFLHLTQTENTICFPILMKEMIFYADISDQEGVFDLTTMITKITDSVISGGMVLKRGGKIWSVARDYILQRFSNIIRVWNVILKPQYYRLAEEIAPNVFFIMTDRPDSTLFMLEKRYLSGPDREVFNSLKVSKKKREFILSRIALKDAVRSYVSDGGNLMYPIEFYCTHDENGRPAMRGYGNAAEKVDSLYVSVAHKGNAAVAIASREPVGIDLEIIEEKSRDFLETAFTEREIELLKALNSPEAAVRFWVAKEASAKKTGYGLKGGPKRFEIRALEGDTLLIGEDRVRTVKIGSEHLTDSEYLTDAEYIVGWTE